ncbi:MAG: hypothetical protein ACR2LA_07190 [Acidimicrobiales bacterium]
MRVPPTVAWSHHPTTHHGSTHHPTTHHPTTHHGGAAPSSPNGARLGHLFSLTWTYGIPCATTWVPARRIAYANGTSITAPR